MQRDSFSHSLITYIVFLALLCMGCHQSMDIDTPRDSEAANTAPIVDSSVDSAANAAKDTEPDADENSSLLETANQDTGLPDTAYEATVPTDSSPNETPGIENTDTATSVIRDTANLTSEGPDTATVTVTGSDSSVTQTTILMENLAVWYPFNGDASDHSGNENHGIVHDAVLVPDRFGNADSAYWFDGTSYIDCGNDETLQITGGLTISVWIQPDEFTTANQGIVSKYMVGMGEEQRAFVLAIENQNHCPGYTSIHLPLLAISANGKYETIATTATPSSTATCADTVLETRQWYHLVAVFQPGEYVAIHLNGELVRRNEESIIPSLHNSTANLGIGYQFLLNDSAHSFHGIIDDVKIYATALSDSEVTLLYDTMIESDKIILE